MKTVFAFVLLLALSFTQQAALAQTCSNIDNNVVTKAVENSGAQTFKVNASDLGAVGQGLTVTSEYEAKLAAYARGYAVALINKLGAIAGGAAIASGTAAVITITYTDGSKEDYFHLPGRTDPESNATVVGTQYTANGTAVCPNGQNSQLYGSGGAAGGGNTGLGSGGGGSGGGGGGYIFTCYLVDPDTGAKTQVPCNNDP